MSKERKPRDRKKAYEIIEDRSGNPMSSSPASRLRLQEQERMLQDAERLELEAIVAQRQQKLDAIKRGAMVAVGGVKSGITADVGKMVEALLTKPNIQKEWLSRSEEERQTILRTVQALQVTGGVGLEGYGGSSGLAMLFPFMLTQMSNKPSTGVKEMVELIQVVTKDRNTSNRNDAVEMMKVMVPLIQAQKQDQNPNMWREAMEVLKPLYTTLSSKDQELYNQQFQFLQSQIQSPVQTLKELRESASLLGFQQAGASALEVEKLRVEQQRWQSEQNFGMEKWRMEMGMQKSNEEARNRMMMKLGTQTLKQVAPLLDSLGRELPKRLNRPPQSNPPPQHQEAAPPPVANAFICDNCGNPISVEGDPDVVTCPSCEKTYAKQA